MTTSASDDPALVLVERALLAIEQDGKADLAEICRDHPELRPLVEQALACRTAATFVVAAAPAVDAKIGTRLGDRYELRRRLGQGAMGAVYEAHDTVLGRTVAAKVLHPSLFGGETQARARFQREARAAAALRHPGIVTVHDHGGGDQPFLIMDLVEAPDLASLIAHVAEAAKERGGVGAALRQRFHPRSPASEWERPWPMLAARAIATAARAVAAAHADGVVHRDLKPSNLLVRGDVSAVVVDFGLARLAGDATLTAANLPVGSPSYMAPEQAAGAGESPASDVYSLGAALYHALALRPPFVGDPGSVLMQVQRDDPAPLMRIDRTLPRDLVVICQKAMAREPRDRYAGAAELADDLEAFVARRPIRARPLAWPQRAVRWARRRPERAFAAALALAFVPASIIATNSVLQASARNRLAAAAEARRAVPALATIEGRNPAENLFRSTRADAAAREALDAVLAADVKDEEALVMRAMLHADEGRHAAAIVDLRSLAAGGRGGALLDAVAGGLAAPEPPPDWPLSGELPAATDALAHFLVAYWSMRVGRFDAADAALTAAFADEPDHVPSWHLLPLVMIARGKVDDLLDLVGAIEQRLGGATARTLHARGFARARKTQWREAAEDLGRSVALAPPSAGTLRNLSVALRNLGDAEGALAALEQAATARPEARGVFLEHFNLLLQLGRKQEALALADALPSDLPVARSTREHALGLVRLDDAWQAYRRGEPVEPMRTEAATALAAAMAAAGNRREAIELELVSVAFLLHRDHQRALDEVLLLVGGDARSAEAQRKVWFHADGAGQAGVARQALERANLLEPSHRDAARALGGILIAEGAAADPARGLLVLAKAHPTAEAWLGAEDLARSGLEAVLASGDLEPALPVLVQLAEAGLFQALPAPEPLLAALRRRSENSRSLPPALAALLGR